MKQLIVCMCVCLMSLLVVKPIKANESASYAAEAAALRYINNIYAQLDFCSNNRIPYEVFVKACHGYLNLKNAGKLNNEREILTICDFTMSSTQNRMWIVDLAEKKILFNTYVAHGQGSGDEFATAFSNFEGSHQSSLGFYVTGDTYQGDHGTSLHLYGMDQGYNDAAYDRAIVVHGADYVCSKFIADNQRLGRSWGCPAVPSELSLPIINTIKNGSCLFIYYPEKSYLKSAYWLNKRIDQIPSDVMGSDLRFASSAHVVPKKTDTVIVYKYVNSRNREIYSGTTEMPTPSSTAPLSSASLQASLQPGPVTEKLPISLSTLLPVAISGK